MYRIEPVTIKLYKMKKIFTLISILSISSAGMFAQTPNAGFETWTHNSFPSYDTPDSWNCANSQTALTGVFSCVKSSSAHSGSFAIQLITKQIGSPINQLVPGFATTGTLPTSITGPITGGIAYTLRPDSITGWYKYTPQGGENGYIQFILFGTSNSDTIATGGFATPAAAVGSYTRFHAEMIYRSANPVTNSMWLLSSSKNDALTASIGSTLFVDDLALVFNPGVGVAEQNRTEVTLFPNPASDRIEIKNILNSAAQFVLYDAMGNKMEEKEIGSVESSVDVKEFANGLYFYTVTGKNNLNIKSGKLIIQK